MGKQTNAQVLRFFKTKDWLSKYYSDSFNYSNLLIQDFLIREYIINVISKFKTKVVQIYIYRKGSVLVIKILSYNDSFTHYSSCFTKHQKKIFYRNNSLNRMSIKYNNIFNYRDWSSEFYNWFGIKDKLSSEIIFKKDQKSLDYIYLKNPSIRTRRLLGFSGKRLLSLNLSYLLKTNVIIKNTNIISNNRKYLLNKFFWPMGVRLRSPLSKYLRVKFVCLVYYSLLYKSSLLLCRYLCFIIPRFCKKKRKNRRINPFFKSLKSLINLMFLKYFSKELCVKGIKICLKGRINGSRRKRTYIIKKGYTSTQSFNNKISYYQDDCLTIFGILGLKVWIIF